MHNKLYNIISNFTSSYWGKKIYYCISNIIFYIIPDKLFVKILYRLRMGRKVNLDNPRYFTEKINWLRINDRRPIKTKLADKYQVRDYVANKVGKEVLIPLIGVYNSFNDIDFDTLPSKFVLKTNHSSGWNMVCVDKDKFDIKSAKKLFSMWFKTNYYQINRAWEYKDIKPKIICEQYISSSENRGLDDYKFHCFVGEPKYIQHITGRECNQTKHKFYDLNWQPQEFTFTNPLYDGIDERPNNFEKMLEIVRQLSKDWPYVRIDLYNVAGNIYFGEVTFHPVNGMDQFKPESENKVWGDLLSLDSLKNKVSE